MLKIDQINNRARRLMQKGLDLLSPPVCAYCGKSTNGRIELCVDCAARYLHERQTTCPRCGQTATFCDCDCEFPRISRTTVGGKTHVSMMFYTGSQAAYDAGRITERMILSLKDKGHFARFFADELSDEIERLFEHSEYVLDDWILTYPPRSIANFMKYGLDQSEEVTKYMAKRLGIPCRRTFVKVQGDEQKTLNAEERMVNASMTLVPRKSAIVKGGKYLLFDDIITSGATVMAAARHLYFCGAAEVFPVSIARKLPHESIHQSLF